MKIAVDAMGGDYAPEAIVEGAVQAAHEYHQAIILVGQEHRVHQELEKYDITDLDIEVRHASQIVDMHDQPSFALRRKKDSSMHVAINLIKKGEAAAAVSAGNTGAAMAIGKVACRMPEGIERPALATVVPNAIGFTVLIDVGANVDCKPIHLLQFAVMGHVYAQEVIGISAPRIGLLSIGEEETKGNVLTREVFEPLSQSELNFIGNAEGRDVFNGRADVIVCDGFIGNVVLKVSESLAKTISLFLKEGFSQSWRTKLGYLLIKPAITYLKKRVDYTEYGGAPLLGLNGVVIVSHGSSKAKAVKNAIRVARESVENHVIEQITECMKRYQFDTKSRAKATSFWRQFKVSLRHDSQKEKEEKADSKLSPETSPEESEHEPDETIHPPFSSSEEEEEEEKKSWWPLKDSKRRVPEKKEDSVDFSTLQDEKEGLKESLEEAPSEEEEKERLEKVEDTKTEKKPWWRLHLPHHEEHKKEAVNDMTDEEDKREQQTALSKPTTMEITEDVSGIEDGDNSEKAAEDPTEHEKKFWWRLKDSASSEQKHEKSADQETEEPEPE